jgi:integrase
MMRGFHDVLVFGVEAASLDTLFRRHRAKAELDGFTFHDTRHTAATRMAQVLHVLDLCKAFGWTDTKRALTYYNPTGSDIAARLNAGRGATPIQ